MTPLPSDIYKSMILSNPFKHQWRLDCLFTIFFDPKAAFSFSEAGQVVPAFDLKLDQRMNHDPKPYAKSLKGSTLSKKEIAIRKDYEKNLYVFLEENIDDIAKSKVHFNERHKSYFNVYPANIITKDSLFFNLPKHIDSVWLEEIREAGSAGSSALWREFCGEYGATDDDTLWRSKEAFMLHREIWSIIKHLQKG